jgi:hypothetical protein
MLFDRHPPGQDVRLHDHERCGAAGHGLLHRGRRGTGRAPRATDRHHPERHPQRVHGAQHLHLSAGTLHAHHRRHLRLHRQKMPASTASASPAITCRKPAPPPTWNWPTPWPTAGVRARGINAGMDIDAFAPRLSFFWAIGHELLHGDRQDAGGRLLWAKLIKPFQPQNPKSMACCAPTARPRAGA